MHIIRLVYISFLLLSHKILTIDFDKKEKRHNFLSEVLYKRFWQRDYRDESYESKIRFSKDLSLITKRPPPFRPSNYNKNILFISLVFSVPRRIHPVDSSVSTSVCLTGGINIFRPVAVGGKRVDNTHPCRKTESRLDQRPRPKKLSAKGRLSSLLRPLLRPRCETHECLFGDKAQRPFRLRYVFSFGLRYTRKLASARKGSVYA